MNKLDEAHKRVLGLQLPTDPRWVNLAEMDLEEILTDHAYCEQKAATSCISPKKCLLSSCVLGTPCSWLRHWPCILIDIVLMIVMCYLMCGKLLDSVVFTVVRSDGVFVLTWFRHCWASEFPNALRKSCYLK